MNIKNLHFSYCPIYKSRYNAIFILHTNNKYFIECEFNKN